MANYVTKTISKIARYFSNSKTEPHIKYKCPQKFQNQDDCYWQVYDPVSGFNGSFGSEGEVRAWLDSRYR